MAKFVNLTPHAITVRQQDGTDITFPPAGMVARLENTGAEIPMGNIEGVPILSRTNFGEVVGLPQYETEGVNYIVSSLVAAHIVRQDVFSPATGPNDGAIRDDKGHIIAVVALKATQNSLKNYGEWYAKL